MSITGQVSYALTKVLLCGSNGQVLYFNILAFVGVQRVYMAVGLRVESSPSHRLIVIVTPRALNCCHARMQQNRNYKMYTTAHNRHGFTSLGLLVRGGRYTSITISAMEPHHIKEPGLNSICVRDCR